MNKPLLDGPEKESVAPSHATPACSRTVKTQSNGLFELTPQQFEHVASTVAGGAENIQDIYPLSPLQEGLLFHRLLNQSGDSYVLATLFELEGRDSAQRFAEALQTVVDRHDVLRSAILWEGVPRPLQVVYRHARFEVEEVQIDSTRGVIAQLEDRMRPGALTWDLTRAPMLRLHRAWEAAAGRWCVALYVHHLACDHESLQMVIGEVLACFDGRKCELPVPVPYREYVTATLAYAGEDDAKRFFSEKLHAVEESTAPFGLSDVHGDATQIIEARLEFDAQLSMRIRAQSSRAGVGPARFFHSAWALVVANTAARDDVVFGTVVMDTRQKSAGERRAVGMAVNTLPLRLQLRGLTAEQLIRHTHEELTDLVQHDQVPLTVALGCAGIAGGAPLFTTLLNYRRNNRDLEIRSTRVAGVRVLGRAEAWTNYPLSVIVDDFGASFSLTVQTDRRVEARRVAAYLHCASESLVVALESAPQTSALELVVLPADERKQVLESFNATHEVEPATDRLIHELFEQQAERTPNAVAITYERESLTYAELNCRANQLARYLRDRGVQPDQLVAICVERGTDMVVGLLAILKAGGAYLPLDPNYPADRLAYMLEDAAPRIMISQERTRGKFSASSTDIVSLDGQRTEIARLPSGNLDRRLVPVTPRHLAYVIYTSGSTGMPKGVMIEHRNVARLFSTTRQWFEFDHRDVWTLFHSYAFDFSVWELWGALFYGGRVVIVPYDTARSAPDFYRLLCRERVTVLNQTPSAFGQLINAQGHEQHECHSLRLVIFGGEALQLHTLRPWIQRNDVAKPQLVNMYGITETTVHVTYRPPLTATEIESERESLIGRPIPDLQVYLLNERGQPVPIGVAGEVHVGGAGVARGYLNLPDLTAARFVPDPFAVRAGLRMYRSGDLGRWRSDGTIEYLGRNDQQVKIRGFRIELGEIEHRLVAHERVKEAVVLASEDACGTKQLVAYVVAESSAAEPNAHELREHLRLTLPEHMVPSAFVSLTALPLTPNGKLDRRALPSPGFDAYARRQYESPQGDVEALLAQAWQDLLRVEHVGRRDNFFALGGHSLLLVRLVERLHRDGCTADVRDVFQRPVLADMAGVLRLGVQAELALPRNLIPADCAAIVPGMLTLVDLNREQIAMIVDSVPGGAANIEDIYPLTPSQEGLLFHHLLEDEHGDAYVVPTLLSIDSRARLAEFVSALQAAVERHEVLRTSVLWEGLPRAVQVVHRRATLSVVETEFDPQRSVEDQLKEWLEPRRQKLDLRAAPLLRLRVAQDPARGAFFALLQLHHIIGDNVSQEMLIAEVTAQLGGEPVERRLHGVPYRCHVARTLARGRAHEEEAFFRGKLADVDEPTAPFGILDVQSGGYLTQETHEILDADTTAALRLLARRLGVSVATIFHAAWGLVVAHTSGRDDVVFGSVLLGRMQGVQTQNTLGMFINTLPLRLRLNGSTAKELIERTQREVIELLNHEQASLARVQRCSGIESPAPLFTALLNFRHRLLNADSPWSRASGIRVLATRNRTNYPVTLSVDDTGEGFELTAQTDRRVDGHRLIGYLRTGLRSLLEAVESQVETPALALQILPDEERRQVVTSFNATQAAYPRDRSIHELFEELAEQRPAALAMVDAGQSLSYAHINCRANQLARFFLRSGVLVGEYVPVHMSRSAGMVIAHLALLKIGAVYVPLDPALPFARRDFLIKDCGARHILADSGAPVDFAPAVVQWIDATTIDDVVDEEMSCDLRLNLSALPPAYVMYTSGSTGVPKGVVVSHRAVIRLAINNGYAAITPTDRVAHHSNPAFDASTFEIWGALLNGASVVVVPQSAVLEVSHFARLLAEQRVTMMYMSAGLFNQCANRMGEVLSKLRYLMVGGDVLDPTTTRRVLQQTPPGKLLNVYGPTECTTFSTSHLIESVAEDARSIPIGRPISNAQIYILDERLTPVPIGVLGEIYIAGVGVADGYLNRPALTAERFVADPVSVGSGDLVYKTGDLGRWRADGVIEFFGRNDLQVKIRGFRIELTEIETCLMRCEPVRDAVVLARQDVPGEKRLVAYVTLRDQVGFGVAELLGHAKRELPEYMVPSAFVVLEKLPLNANGKIDRKALPAPDLAAFARCDYEPARGDVELQLTRIWRELLGLDRVGRDGHFFELGGHSLSAMQLVSRIQSDLAVEIPIRFVFEAPTIADLAGRIDALRALRLQQGVGADSDEEALLELLKAMPEHEIDNLLRELQSEARS